MEELQGSSAFLMCNMKENWRLSREAEEKRFILATVNVLIATTLQIILVFAGFQQRLLPVTGWMILIGVYGAFAGLKLYERSQFHIVRARKLRAKLDLLYPNAELEHLFQLGEQEQQRAYPWLVRIRLNTIWTILHVLIAVLGVIYSFLCLSH